MNSIFSKNFLLFQPTNPFENDNRSENELKIDETQVVKAESVGQVLHAHAKKRKTRVSLRKTSTPIELEASTSAFGVMVSFL